jgi:hypothetical protein
MICSPEKVKRGGQSVDASNWIEFQKGCGKGTLKVRRACSLAGQFNGEGAGSL